LRKINEAAQHTNTCAMRGMPLKEKKKIILESKPPPLLLLLLLLLLLFLLLSRLDRIKMGHRGSRFKIEGLGFRV
jgi:hypothetical protein